MSPKFPSKQHAEQCRRVWETFQAGDVPKEQKTKKKKNYTINDKGEKIVNGEVLVTSMSRVHSQLDHIRVILKDILYTENHTLAKNELKSEMDLAAAYALKIKMRNLEERGVENMTSLQKFKYDHSKKIDRNAKQEELFIKNVAEWEQHVAKHGNAVEFTPGLGACAESHYQSDTESDDDVHS
jgi:gamma-glutamylcyclotransferase (GGCT)/AIG2-like uncharacterized protein YtfP